MKIKHLILVSLLLAILTIGAVSASEDAALDELAADNEIGGGEIASSDDGGAVAQSDNEGDNLKEEKVNYYIDLDDSVIRADEDESNVNIYVYNKDITGNVTIEVDEEIVYNEEIIPFSGDWDEDDNYITSGGNYFNLMTLDLKQGEHSVVVNYAGDGNYEEFTENFTFNCYFLDVHVEDETTSTFLDMELASDATGKVEVLIDNKSYGNYTAEEIRDDEGVELTGLAYGPHTYEVRYTGDDKYVLEESIKGQFNLTYRFFVYREDDYDEFYIDNTACFYIIYPRDADGQVIITYNNYTVTKNVKGYSDEDDFYVYLSNFTAGENNITFTFKDSKYPEKSIIRTVYASPRLSVPSFVRYNNDEDLISILLPADARGNLVVSKRGEWNESSDDYDWTVIANITVKSGKANYSLSSLGLGQYYIYASYDGEDYSEYIDYDDIYEGDDGRYVRVGPDVEVERYVYANATNTIKVVLPDDVGDNLTVTVKSDDGEWDDELEEYVYDFNEEIYNQVANGTVIIPLPKLEVGNYQITVTYGEEFNDDYYMEVRGTDPQLDLNIFFPAIVSNENHTVYFFNLPDDLYGHFDLYVDGELFEDDIYIDEDGEYYFYYGGYGQHTWEIRLVGDEYYTASKNGTFFKDWVDMDSQYYADDEIDVSIEKEGYVELKIDGKAFNTEVLDEGYASFSLEGLSIGNHTYEISYYDKNNTRQLTKSGVFLIDYSLYTDIDDEETYPQTNEFEIRIYLPEDAKATVTVDVNGTTYTVTPINGTASAIIKNLKEGENNITVTYAGDSKYPTKQIKETINVEGFGIIVKYLDEELEYISLSLPSDADGNLTFYNAYYVSGYEDEYGDWIDGYWEVNESSIVLSKPLKDGFIKITPADFAFGVYDLFAVYESPTDDYDVDSKEIHFDMVPEVNITENIVIGENATITIVIPGATGELKIYKYEGYDEQTEEDIWTLFATLPSDNGTFTKTISGLTLGEHSFTFEYPNEAENIFNSHRWYSIDVSPKNASIQKEFSADGSGVITLELPEGANGTVSVYETDEEGIIIGTIIKDAPYTSANKTISITGLKTGYHNIKVKYTDEKNGNYTFSAEIRVPKPDAGSNVTIPETITGDSLDITLPKDATGGILVSIDGESKYLPLVNGTAKVDVSNLTEGAHTVTVKYMGDGNYSGFEKTVNVTVPSKTPTVPAKIVAKDLSAYYNKATYSVTVYGTDGNLAKGVTVVFKVDGKQVGTAKTNDKGIATIKLKQVPKSYKITTEALGVKVTKKLTVKQVLKLKKVKVKKSAKKLVITATLKEGKKALKGQKITFKFNGKKYTAKTNKKGVAKVTIKKKILKKLKKGKKVKYQATYLKDTVKVSVKVKK